jgi:predicted PurR-regulated permease PerM
MEARRSPDAILTKPRIAFLLILALGITVLFYWMIQGFVVAVLVAAVLAAIVYPFCHRLADRLGGRKSMAAAVTVLLSLMLVIVPVGLFLGILVGEAISVSESAGEWITAQMGQPGSLRQQLEADPDLKRLLPSQEEINAKAGQLVAKTGAFVADALVATVEGTAQMVLMLFVMLYAMFFFLVHGKDVLDAVLRFLPLAETDKDRLLGIYASVGRATLKGTVIIGIIQGGLAALSFWVAGIDGVVFWGVVMAVLSILPGIGSALVWVPAVIYLAINGQMGAAIGVALWCAIVVGTVDNFLRPMLVGKDTEMPDLLVMLTTLGGLAAFGAPGLLIGPIIGALYMSIWQLLGSAIDETRDEAHTPAAPNSIEK